MIRSYRRARRALPVALLLAALSVSACDLLLQGGGPLRVMTFNIRYGAADDGDNHWQRRRAMFMALLRDEAPDVIGMQEALSWQLAEILDSLRDYESVGVGRDDGDRRGEFVPVLTRRGRVRVDTSDTFWFSDTPGIPGTKHWGNTLPRICTWARCTDLRTGRVFTMYNVHLDHESAPAREKSLRLLRERIARAHAAGAVLVTGDFNAGERDPIQRALTDPNPGDTLHFTDSYRVLHPDVREAGTYHAFKGTTAGDKIDFIYTDQRARILRADILRFNRNGRYPSDHFPVTATVELR
jgi:endonuclease/exonuclease/phosphatase family metal-dependent hydrolase